MFAIRNPVEDPAQNLPVAAHPTMIAAVVSAEVTGIVVNEFDVGDQSGARVRPFDEVVTQQVVLRKAVFEGLAQNIHFVDALAGKTPFTEQILVDVGDGAGIDIESGL